MLLNRIRVIDLVAFSKLSERRQSTFANNLKIPKKPKSDEDESEARNYWHRCLTGISTASKQNDNDVIKERIESLLDVYEPCEKKLVRLMYKRNLEILKKYEEFNFVIWYPTMAFKFVSKNKAPLTIKDIPLEVRPQHVFTFGKKETPSFGGIFFVASVQGYRTNDLGIISEAVFKHLREQYPEPYYIDPNYCIAVDVSSMELVRYQEILVGKIPSLLQTLADKLSKLL
jgi:NAD-dependent dihydropyrimidine dehydrogenase PreA subunit